MCCVATATVAFAGCGGSSSSGLSKSELARKADAVCTAYTQAANKIPQPSDFGTNPVTAAAYLDKLKPLVSKQERDMQALKPDSSVKALWDRFLAAGERTTSLFNDADAKAHAKNPAGLSDLEQAAALKQRTLTPIASQLGARACAR